MGIEVIQSEIECVTVYSSGAMVTRVAELTPTGGAWPAQVRVAGLPLALDDASVKIRVEGGNEAGPRAVSFRVGLEVLDGSSTPEAFEEPLRAARQEVFVLEERLKDVERRAQRFKEMSPPARPAPAEGEAPPPAPYAGRIALMDFRQERLKALRSAAEDLRQKIRAAREVLASAEERKRRAGTAREARPNELRKTVVAALSAPVGEGAARARLVLEYRVPGARWAPAYTVHFDKDLSHATVSVRAMVAQRTGEDWGNVRLTLSTAQMQAWTELPELTSLRVGRWQSPLKSGWRSPPAGAGELYADYDREATAARPGGATARFADLEKLLELVKAGESPGQAAPSPVPVQQKLERTRPASPRARIEGVAAEFAKLGQSETAAAALAAPGDFTMLFQAPPAAAPQKPTGPGEFTRIFAAPLSVPAAPMAAMPASQQPGGITASFRAPAPPSRQPQQPAAPASLDYGAMYMPGPNDPGRGKLTRVELSARLEVFAQLQVKVRVDAVTVVAAARTDAAQLGNLPALHAFPSSVEGFDYAYRAELPVDIRSDGRFHSIPLATHPAAARLYYVTVPRETSDVFRFVEMGNPLDAPLLPGPADIYAGAAFLMTAPLRLTPAKGVIKLGLGVEQRIKVARNTAFAESAAGLMGGTLNLKHEIHIELRNLLALPAQIEVRERVPVTRDGDEQLKVTASAKPPWEPYDPPEGSLRGGYVWKVQVQPAEVMHLDASYNIGMPSKMEIATGNRREA